MIGFGPQKFSYGTPNSLGRHLVVVEKGLSVTNTVFIVGMAGSGK